MIYCDLRFVIFVASFYAGKDEILKLKKNASRGQSLQ